MGGARDCRWPEWFWLARSRFAQKYQPVRNVFENVILTVMIFVALCQMGSAFKTMTPMLPAATLLLDLGLIASM